MEVTAFMKQTQDARIREVHPELSFQELARQQNRTITASKKTWNGIVERWRLLQTVGLAATLKPSTALRTAAFDDVLDAAVGSWTAHRIASGQALSIPESGVADRPPAEVLWI